MACACCQQILFEPRSSAAAAAAVDDDSAQRRRQHEQSRALTRSSTRPALCSVPLSHTLTHTRAESQRRTQLTTGCRCVGLANDRLWFSYVHSASSASALASGLLYQQSTHSRQRLPLVAKTTKGRSQQQQQQQRRQQQRAAATSEQRPRLCLWSSSCLQHTHRRTHRHTLAHTLKERAGHTERRTIERPNAACCRRVAV